MKADKICAQCQKTNILSRFYWWPAAHSRIMGYQCATCNYAWVESIESQENNGSQSEG